MEKNNQYILACIDGAAFSEAVCDFAVWIAQTVDAPLKLLHTIEHDKTASVSDLSGAIGLGASEDLLNELTEVEKNRSRLLIKKGNIMLQSAKQKALTAGLTELETRQKHGSLAESLIDMEEQIRVLVIGIRGESHTQEASGLGNQIETIIRSLHKPILVVNREFNVPKKIMLAYNGSAASRKALQMIAASPLFKKIPCHVVHVAEDEKSAEPILAEAFNKLTAANIEVHTACVFGNLEDALTAYQHEHAIDLTLMGAFSHSKVRDFLMGSFTAKMLKLTKQPLLLLR